MAEQQPSIARPLLSWFRKHKRDLPWRQTSEPYAIWISEVMLQQTRVATVIPYYERFLTRFPDVATLAAADEDEVLEHWAGLGYYSRGRNLHRAAQCVVREHASRFPGSATELRTLPGIGEYTAAAVSSIAYGEAVPVIDGNVERVLCRYFAIGGDPKKGTARRSLLAAAAQEVPARSAGDYNQAVMELGATVCTPRDPDCHSCPIRGGCRARALNVVDQYPTPRLRKAPETQHWVACVVVQQQRGYPAVAVLRSAPSSELLPRHWGVPLVRCAGDAPPSPDDAGEAALALARRDFGAASLIEPALKLTAVRHSITYRRLHMHPVTVQVPGPLPEEARLCTLEDADTLPALHRKLIRACIGS